MTLTAYLKDKRIRYLITGGLNSIIGYSIGLLFYDLLKNYLNIIFIVLLVNAITITLSFVTYKFFVFKTKSNWFKEYIKSYLVYGGGAIVSAFGIWLLVDKFNIPFWISQGLMIGVIAIYSYVMHSKYTFKVRVDK
ncbi:GtrA family protein [Polynucleobacter paneuropaeus]|nr:GtrA family protein [Polynucleobacter paneuropaeus]